ncbi:DUF6691 family protein [Dyella sp. C9]|uniref:DUF6691 family protein n=1 Tax=Dyella sp. C9 TaxID=2202154 RepID=UPI0018E598E2|nr:DUF6691 family protein [Dyella sp. C9]
MKILMALAAGLLFGLGLSLAGMTQPAVVLGFLDVAGAWNPQLLFVMAGAVLTTAVGYRLVWRRSMPWLATGFALPRATRIDARLLGGAALFGIGWGIAGYCPGPALVALAGGIGSVGVLVAAMALGWWLAAQWQARTSNRLRG